LFKRLIKSIKYDHAKKSRSFVHFMEELPYKLKIELAMDIHKRIYQTISFFKDKDKNFIAWIGTLLRPINVQQDDFIYREGEDV